jgi:hypothetical protein
MWTEFVDPSGDTPQMVNLSAAIVSDLRERTALLVRAALQGSDGVELPRPPGSPAFASSKDATDAFLHGGLAALGRRSPLAAAHSPRSAASWEFALSLFDDAAWEVFHLMRRDTYERFAEALMSAGRDAGPSATSAASARRLTGEGVDRLTAAPFAATVERDGRPMGLLRGTFRVVREVGAGAGARAALNAVAGLFRRRKLTETISKLQTDDEAATEGHSGDAAPAGDVAVDEAEAEAMDFGFEDDEDLTAALMSESGASSSSVAKHAPAPPKANDTAAATASDEAKVTHKPLSRAESKAKEEALLQVAERIRATLGAPDAAQTAMRALLQESEASLRWANEHIRAMTAIVDEEIDDEEDDGEEEEEDDDEED